MKIFNKKFLTLSLLVLIFNQQISSSQVLYLVDQYGIFHREISFNDGRQIIIETFYKNCFVRQVFSLNGAQPPLRFLSEENSLLSGDSFRFKEEDLGDDDVFFDDLDKYMQNTLDVYFGDFKKEFLEFDVSNFIVADEEVKKIAEK